MLDFYPGSISLTESVVVVSDPECVGQPPRSELHGGELPPPVEERAE